MRILAIAGLSLTLMMSVGCRHEPTAAEIKEYYDEKNDRADLELAKLEVQNAKMDEEIARLDGKKVDPRPLQKAQVHLYIASEIVATWDVRRDLAEGPPQSK